MEADLVSSLMSRGSLHHLVVSILVHLDPASLAAVASCCRLWAAFVREHVTKLSDTEPCTRIVELQTKHCEGFALSSTR